MSSQVLSRDEIEEIVIGNAMKDPQYRDALLKNPKKVIETLLNNRLPDGLNVKVVQESGDTIFLRLPHKISEGCELSDTELEQVAGGIQDLKGASESLNRPRGIGATLRNLYGLD